MFYLLLRYRYLIVEYADIALKRSALLLFFGKHAALFHDVLFDGGKLGLETGSAFLQSLGARGRRSHNDKHGRHDRRRQEKKPAKAYQKNRTHRPLIVANNAQAFRAPLYSFFAFSVFAGVGTAVVSPGTSPSAFSSPIITVSGAGVISTGSSLNSFTETTISSGCVISVALGGSLTSFATMWSPAFTRLEISTGRL